MSSSNQSAPETETIDRLFLELSQFSNARTRRELDRDIEIAAVRNSVLELSWQIENLPASHQQTRASEMCAAIGKRLNELLP